MNLVFTLIHLIKYLHYKTVHKDMNTHENSDTSTQLNIKEPAKPEMWWHFLEI